MRGLVGVLMALVVISACGGRDDAPQAASPVPPPQSPSLTQTTRPDPGAAVELVYISDSSGWETGEAYAALAQKELGVPVELVDLRIGSLQMIDVPEVLENTAAVIRDAEIIVLWANPTDSGVKDGIDRCHLTDEYGDPGQYTLDDWAPFVELTGQVLDEIWRLREERPTVVRVTDLYVPVGSDWDEHGIWDACMAAFETMSDAARSAAESHGATFVSALDVYNGPDHRQDPVAAGLISYDGVHPGEAGGKAMAEALAATGFDPTPAPGN